METTEHTPAPDRECMDCRGAGTRSWPQSRRDHLGRLIERLPDQVWKCGACSGTGRQPQILNTYRFEGKRRMPIGASMLQTTIQAPSYREALASLLEAFPEVDPLTVRTTV